MRVCQIIETVDPASGGTTSAFLGLLDALARTPGVQLAAAAHLPTGASLDGRLSSQAREALTLTGPSGLARPGALAPGAIEMMRKFKPDVVHLHALWSADLIAIARAARSMGARTVWQPHGMLVRRAYKRGQLKKSLFLRALGLARELRSAGAIIYASEFEREQSSWLPPARRVPARLIPLPVDIPVQSDAIAPKRAAYRAASGIDPDAPLVVFLGRLHAVKRVDLAISAFAHATKAVPDAQMLVLGGGEPDDERELKDLAERLAIADRVRFAGWIEPARRWDALCAADCLVLCSMFENFGFVVPEALGVGATVAITDQLAMSHAVAELELGWVCRSTPESLGEGIAKALTDPKQKERSSRAQAWVRETFSPASVALNLKDLYESLTPAP